jgi:RNA polymerase sigma-70 factor (ECF subfamily)
VEDDAELVEALRAGDETAFRSVVAEYNPVLIRVARGYVPSQAVAEEVAQETWLGVLNGLDRFEGRSSFKTWLFRILVNRARTRGTSERRTVPFDADDEGPVVPADRFEPSTHPMVPVHWATPPAAWGGDPTERIAAANTRQALGAAIDALPPAQREVVTLRDVHGWSAAEVCNALDLTETNQRVLLHRARAKLRVALDEVYTDA